MAGEWDATVVKEIKNLNFDIREVEEAKKVFCLVESEHGYVDNFECDAQDIQGLRQLLIKHGVLTS